jgi:DNA-binding response OmpR family regulator
VALALVVEDDQQVAGLIRLFLRREGFDADCAESLQQAVVFLNEKLKRYGLVYIDAGLPDGCGGDLIAWAQQGRPDLPVVLASGDAEKLQTTPGRFVPLEKPFSAEAFVAAVRAAVVR